MTQIPHPLALTPALPSELLTYILTYRSHPTTLIICQPRAAFLSSLQRCIPNTVPRQPPSPAEDGPSSPIPLDDDQLSEMEQDAVVKEMGKREKERRHPLLIPTLQQVVESRDVNLVFVQTLSHLRAYLSVFLPAKEGEQRTLGKHFEKSGNRRPLLVVYGLAALHRDTSEWSVQGLGNSLAGLVEAGKRGGRKLVVIEEKAYEGYHGDEGAGGQDGGSTGWDERMPMLNGNVRRAGLESEDGGWSGRTVEVGRVLSRWFRFERGAWDAID